MAEVIREERVADKPRDTVVVERDGHPRSGNGWIIALVILLIIILFMYFGSSLGTGGGGTDVNVQPNVPSAGQ